MLPPVAEADLIPTDTPCSLDRLVLCDGHVPTEDIRVVCRLAASLHPNAIFEFGTFRGLTAYNLARNCQHATVFTIDIPREAIRLATFGFDGGEIAYADKECSGDLYQETPEAQRIIQLVGDSSRFDFSPYFGKMDFVFVDGSHAYENCLNDSLRAASLVRRGGVIAWHDYGKWPGVTTGLEQLQSSSNFFRDIRHVAETSVAVLVRA